MIKGGGLPALENPLSECAAHVRGESGSCLRPREQKLLQEVLHLSASQALHKFGLTKESALWENEQVRQLVGPEVADAILRHLYKPRGPALNTDLLSNFDIDDILQQWSEHRVFGRHFYALPYQMIDFLAHRTELATLDLLDLKRQGYDCFAVVLNTDVFGGAGKHWFCLFGDLSGDGSEKSPFTLEYFNSSGNIPDGAITFWLERTAQELMRAGYHSHIIRASPYRLQYSRTECGVWCLVYIRSRLEGRPPNWFYLMDTKDEEITLFRQHLFRV